MGRALATCIFLFYGTYISLLSDGASPGALAPAAGQAPARIPNYRRLLGGALAQRLQHVNHCMVRMYRY